MDPFENSYFTMNRRMMTFLGVWCSQTHKERLFRNCLLSLVFIYTLPDQLCQFFMSDLSLHSIVMILQVFIPYVSIVSIYSTVLLRFVTFQEILFSVKRDWQRIKDDVELDIMRKHAYKTKLITIISIVLITIYGSVIIVTPILRKFLSKDDQICTVDYFPITSCVYNFLDQDTYYYPIILYQIIFIILLSSIVVICYSTYMLMIHHTCACLSLIKNEIHRPFIKNNHNDNIPVKPIDLSHWIIDIIQRLTRITNTISYQRFVNLVNTLIEKCSLVQLLLACALLVIDLQWLPTLLEHAYNGKDTVRSFIFVISTFFTMYTNCYIGQRLIDYSVDVYKEACMVPIHEISVKTQKLLLMALTISVKPQSLSIGKLFILSHEFFADLLRTSLSFAMMVYSTQKA